MDDQNTQADDSHAESLPVEFKFEGYAVRTVMKDGELCFVAADVCEVLGIKNPTDAIGRLDDDEKALAFIEGIPGGQGINIVNQFGLTRLILRSNKPKAKQFQRWVIHEVLPSICKTGRYDVNQDAINLQLSRAAGEINVVLPCPGLYLVSAKKTALILSNPPPMINLNCCAYTLVSITFVMP
jgi:prophage antirepressor-like protein